MDPNSLPPSVYLYIYLSIYIYICIRKKRNNKEAKKGTSECLHLTLT